MEGSRLERSQKRQAPSCVKHPHSRQEIIFKGISLIFCEKATSSDSFQRKSSNENRSAVLDPTPGSFFRNWMSFWTVSGYFDFIFLD